MRNLTSILVVVLLMVGLTAATTIEHAEVIVPGMAKFKWVNTSHDFGKIEHNAPVEHKFEFTNTGNTPLIISSVKPSCGCTITEYTKDPVPPGKKGFVKATYDTKRMGIFNKSIRVTANIEGGAEMLFIKGEVVAEINQEAKSK